MADEISLQEADGIRRVLTRRTARGLVIFGILRIAALIALGLFTLAGDHAALAASFFALILFGLGYEHVKKRHAAALLIIRDPQMIYWAHPTRITAAMARHPAGNVAPLTVHLRNGEQFEATLAPSEQKKFVEWLGRVNPTIRWGPYDDVGATPSQAAPVIQRGAL